VRLLDAVAALLRRANLRVLGNRKLGHQRECSGVAA
jgi:hypothetical protein